MATTTIQDPVQPLPLGAVAGYGHGQEDDVAVAAEETPSQATPVQVYPASETAPLVNQSTSSLGGNKPIPSNRQADFEKLFGQQLPKPKGENIPTDFLTVLQTQSADLQASVLLHGRLYLTRYHLCFRSNIMGYVTEKIHDLRDITVVERSTTAKWIQNAVSIELDTTSDEKVVGYGSMGDREAMYTGLMEVWKERAPERHSAYMDKLEKEKELAVAASSTTGTPSRHRSATTATTSGVPKVTESAGRHRAATAAGELEHGETGGPAHATIAEEKEDDHDAAETTEGKETECSGEHFDELALDTTLPVEMKQLFKLMYHTPEFGRDFLENKQSLTDVDVSEWAEKEGSKERTLKYVMHMNNYIGPKKSDCIGSERIEVENPDGAYEIVSETQTPDVPSGKSFKIHTRTCLTQTVVDGTPSTRMYCTTQCDWSSSSMLKSTITPAVIKGQKEYHQNWLAALKEWIDSHPEDFTTPSTGSETPKATKSSQPAQPAAAPAVSEKKVPERSVAPIDAHVVDTASAIHSSTDITQNQPMMIILLVCLLSLALNVYLVSK